MPYISRPQSEAFLSKVTEAVQQLGTHPIVFQVSGIGGVGKSTLLEKLEESQKQAQVVKVSFGETEGIDEPIQLMRKLHAGLEKQHPTPKGLKKDVRDTFAQLDPFSKLYEQFADTLYRLQTQSVDGKASVSDEQIKQVKQLVKEGVSGVGDFFLPGVASNTLGKAAELSVDAASLLLSEKDRLLQQHSATRGKRELQELMASPVPKLTQAFTESLGLRSKKRSVILILDTYEKAHPDIDRWLWRSLLCNTELQPYSIRIVVASRYPLTRESEWRKLRDRQLLWEQSLEQFDWKQTEQYLQEIGITSPDQVAAVWKTTKGLPYYLNCVRRKHEANQEFDSSQAGQEAGQEIEDLLLGDLSNAEKQVVRQAACCNWFDRRLIQHLIPDQEDRDWFEWLKQQHFVKFAQGRYRFADVARHVFRQALWDDDREQFQQSHATLAHYFEAESNQEVAPESSPSAKYKNSEWRDYRSEFLYHVLFARLPDVRVQMITHLLESCYFQEDISYALRANLYIDTELSQFLGQDLKAFLDSICTVLFWCLPLDRNVLEGENFRQFCPPESFAFCKSSVEACVKTCLKALDKLEGLAKFAALLYQSQWCPSSQQLDWLHQARQQAEMITTSADSEYGSGLFLRIGHRFEKVGKSEEAVAAYDQALEIDSNNRYALLGKAFVLSCDLNQPEKAISILDRILDIAPNDDEAWKLKGLTFTQLRQYEDAINSFDRVIAINPDCQQAFFWFYRGLGFYSLRRYEDAVDSLDRGIQIEPDNGSYWEFRGNALSSLKRYEEAIISYDKAIAIDSNDDSVWFHKSFALSQLGRYEEALIGYDKAVEINPTEHRAWFQRFSILFQLGRYEEATDSYKRALNINPNDPDIPRMPKEVLETPESVREIVGNWHEFLESCDRNLEVKPDDVEMWCQRGIVLNLLARHEQAIASFDRALAIDPDYLEAWNLRRLVPGGLGREEEALASFDRTLAVNPKNPQVLYYRGCALADLKRYEAALSTFDDVLKLDQDHHEAWSSRGEALEKLGYKED
jgi:tetratricopeptide (TPR) repeat protein